MPDLVPQNQSSPSATTAQLNFSSTEAYIKAEKRKKVRKDWKLPQSCSGDNESDHELHQWRPPDPIEVLRYMLQKVRILNSDRYGEYLQQIEEESFIQEMIDLLRPQAWEIFKSREYTREKLLQIAGKPSSKGVYLHIIWRKNQETQFYLYVGQSIEMEERLKHHQDITYRARHPCLHCFVWDSGLINKEKETEDIFVFLTSFDDYIHPLKLNLLEMWCSLILQTLTRNAITAYCEQVSPHAGKHLNVALPLHQCYNGEKRTDLLHGDLYRSHDPLIQEYWKSLRRAFYDLKYSENPLQRAYYDNTMKRQQKAAGDTERNRTAKTALNGMEVILRVRPERSTQEFVISHFKFNISPRWVRLKADATIQVRCYLENENHPHAFALASSSIDPACRLGIHIGGIDLHGNAFEGWLQSKTSKAVLQMNTFVDMLEGLDIWDPADRKRRWVPGKPRGGPKPYYV